MNISEAHAVNRLINFVIGRPITSIAVTNVQARKDATWLAGRARKALDGAGIADDMVRAHWPVPDITDNDVVRAAIAEWDAGRIAPHDALVVIRDQLHGAPIPGTDQDGATHA